ncbi:hypothetical protein CYMTET_12510 [Cymbomonas tetramitiformis]|uniref:Rab-GAP TBC domain-containing protein n=1 Tax=Cymbomonas tetramitiformis TaxID=36881 RepID=A0AAE0LC00_9CHLO|nr:hypothetical protein CYMTET_12510 [Cymbomonas tetramitiformis]
MQRSQQSRALSPLSCGLWVALVQLRTPEDRLQSDDERLFDKLERFNYLGASKEASIAIIPVDVNRTFPSINFFLEEAAGTLHSDLCEVLEAYAFYRPDVGYVQGMSYLAGFFLLAMDKIDAFTCFANLLNMHFFRSLFCSEEEKRSAELQCHYEIFQARTLPEDASFTQRRFEERRRVEETVGEVDDGGGEDKDDKVVLGR